MDNDAAKLRHQLTQETAHAQQTIASQPTAREFKSVEDLLRSDAAQTVLPDNLPKRLSDSLAREPLPRIPWWRRWFRKGPQP